MKRIIRLTERDLTRLVRKTINELDRSSYEDAAKEADKRGYKNLADKFISHGKEYGLRPEKEEITMYVQRTDNLSQQLPSKLKVRIDGFENTGSDGRYSMKTVDVDTGEEKLFYVNTIEDGENDNGEEIISKIKNFLLYKEGNQNMSGYYSKPGTISDVDKILKRLKHFNKDVSYVSRGNKKLCAYEYSGF